MARTGAALALLASLGLTGLLALRLREQHYSGPAYQIDREVCTFFIEDPPTIAGNYVSYPKLPRTFSAELGTFSVRGTKGDSDLVFELRLPLELRVHAVKDARVEIRHAFLDLPIAGPIAGRTTVRVGSAEWRQDSSPLWGTLAGIAAVPIFIWLLVAVPFALLEKRPARSDPNCLSR